MGEGGPLLATDGKSVKKYGAQIPSDCASITPARE